MIFFEYPTDRLLRELGQEIAALKAENLHFSRSLIAAKNDWSQAINALADCLTQMRLMQGLFADIDGAIATAIRAGERALATTPSLYESDKYPSTAVQPLALEDQS